MNGLFKVEVLLRTGTGHNLFLNVAVQCGLLGIAAIIFLIAHVARRTCRLPWDQHRLIQVGLGLAWLNAFAYQGLTGSYEDARHLWVLLGLIVVAGRTSTAATVARVAIPVWLVSFAVFDSVTGLGSGLAVRHAKDLSGPEQQGAASTAEYLLENKVTADFSPVWFVQAAALLTAVIATALVLRSADASRAVFVTMLIGALLVFHAGPAAAVGLVALAAAFFLADREGLFLSSRESVPAA